MRRTSCRAGSFRQLLIGSLASALVAGTIGACADKSDSSSGAAGAPPAVQYSQTECGICALDECASAVDECQTDPGCTGYADCLLACPVDDHGNAETSCEEGCSASGSTETAKLVADLTACRQWGPGATGCSACGMPTTPISDNLNQDCEPRPEPAPTACRQCYWDRCCDTWDACFAEGVNPDCDALATCIQSCSDPFEPCVDACFEAHPASEETLMAQMSCGLSQCAMEQVNCDATLRDECDECLFVDCGDAFVGMLSTAEGFVTYMCMADCGSAGEGPACIDACITAHPEAEEAVMLWASCVDFRCGTLC